MVPRWFSVTLLVALLVGCGKPDPARTCADLPNVKDPAEREALLKQCPRAGGSLTPSKKKEW